MNPAPDLRFDYWRRRTATKPKTLERRISAPIGPVLTLQVRRSDTTATTL
jgi:hypothetical protein